MALSRSLPSMKHLTLGGLPVTSGSPWVPSWCGECGEHHWGLVLCPPWLNPGLDEHREQHQWREGHSGLQRIETISLLLSPGRGAACGQMVFLSDLVAVSSSLSCRGTVGSASGATTCSLQQEPVREPGLEGCGVNQGMEPEPNSPDVMAAGKFTVHCDPQLLLAVGGVWRTR